MTLSEKSDSATRYRELLRDADYFAGELIRRSEALARLYPKRQWQTAALLARRIRLHARRQLEA